MTKKQRTDAIIAILLIVCGSVTLLLPLIGYSNIRNIFITIMSIYALTNLIQFIATRETKDYEGLLTFLVSIGGIILALILNLKEKSFYLALALIIWVFLMSLVKLKKADYYHDRSNKLWILKIFLLFIFILIGLLTSINLYYEVATQILMLGNFFFIHGVIEFIDPITLYLMENR